MIEVRLFATLREGRQKIYHLPAKQFQTGQDVLDELRIPVEEVAIYLMNGRHSKAEDCVKDEDILAIFPPVGGG